MSHSRHDLVHPRDEIIATMERIYRFRMTTTSGGNLSIREENGDIWITPARVDKGTLRREDIVCVHADGSIEGIHAPSSEFPFHRSIYAARPDLTGIVHAHSVALVAFSISGKIPDTRVFHHAREVCGEVGFAPYGTPGSEALAGNIVGAFAQGPHCVLLENHGVVVGGEGLQNAFQRFETLEFLAKTVVKASILGQVHCLSDEQLCLPERAAAALPPFEPEAATSTEKELRRQLCIFLRRGYRNRLMISTQGSLSARVDDDSFLITPHDHDRQAIELDDLVLVRRGKQESGKVSSHAARLHAAIYARHGDIQAITNAYTVNAAAFSITAAPLESRTIPESYLLVRDALRVPFGDQFRHADELAAKLSLDSPVAILENNGVLVCGTGVLDAFDRLEVLESTAETLINGRLVGQTHPMPETVIRELCDVFLKKKP